MCLFRPCVGILGTSNLYGRTKHLFILMEGSAAKPCFLFTSYKSIPNWCFHSLVYIYVPIVCSLDGKAAVVVIMVPLSFSVYSKQFRAQGQVPETFPFLFTLQCYIFRNTQCGKLQKQL